MWVARAPNHLGDGVMALPALRAVAAVRPLVIQGPRWAPDLYRDLPAEIRPIGEIPPCDGAIAFPPSLGAAWAIRRARVRVGVGRADPAIPGVPRGDLRLRRWLLTDAVDEAPHQRDTWDRLARAAGAEPTGDAVFARRPGDPDADVPDGHVGLNPVAAGGDSRSWAGFATLAARLGRPVVFYGGPGEEAAVRQGSGDHPTRIGLSLPAFAAALARCALLVTVDTGAAHFARAVGTPTLVLHTSTAASRSGAAGAVAIEGPDPGCRPCHARSCAPGHRGCGAIPVERVEAAVRAALA